MSACPEHGRRVVPNTRWPAVNPVEGREPATAGIERQLLIKLSELRHHQLAAARVEAEITPLARALADANGEYLRPTIAQLRLRLGVKP